MKRSIVVPIRMGDEPDPWAKLYGVRQGELLTTLERAIVDLTRPPESPSD